MKQLISNNQEFVDDYWYGSVGIVLVQDQLTFEMVAYIKDKNTKNGPTGYGHGEFSEVMEDILDVMGYGYTFNKDAAKIIFKHISFDETKPFREANPCFLL